MSEPAPRQALSDDVVLDLEWLGDDRLRGRAGAVSRS